MKRLISSAALAFLICHSALAADDIESAYSELKTAIRATQTAIATGDKTKAAAALKLATKKLDKATSKGVIHANQAANKKSAISKAVAAL